MPSPHELSDLQMILLTIASRRQEHIIHPLPKAAGADAAAIEAALADLLARELLVQTPIVTLRQTWLEQEGQRIGLKLTEAALQLVADDAPAEKPIGSTATPQATSKVARVLELLRRPSGASLAELASATGWLAHTTRAALTSLRKKGHRLDKNEAEGATRYTIVGDGQP